jgi:hypothetical protein
VLKEPFLGSNANLCDLHCTNAFPTLLFHSQSRPHSQAMVECRHTLCGVRVAWVWLCRSRGTSVALHRTCKKTSAKMLSGLRPWIHQLFTVRHAVSPAGVTRYPDLGRGRYGFLPFHGVDVLLTRSLGIVKANRNAPSPLQYAMLQYSKG